MTIAAANAAYDTGPWSEFAIALVGAAAAAGTAGGLYWLVPGVVLGLCVGLVNSWVALIEILR
jgi:hypothetical protein